MAGFSTLANDHLIRSNIWSKDIKEILLDELFATKYVRMLTDFPDGDTINIPSMGQMELLDYAEGQAIRYTGIDTGNFTFSITKYKSAATYIYEKFKQDSFYMNEVVSSFVPKMHRALSKRMEVDVLAVGPSGQTASNANQINSADHRWVAQGGVSAAQSLSAQDFAKALYALQKANVPTTNLVAIVDPSVEYTMNTLTNLVNMSNNPRWEGIVADGIATGTRFVKNIYGFDVYVSQNLASIGAETIGTRSSTTGVANLFFSAAPGDTLPFVGAMRQAPKVDSEFNKDLQRDEYVLTCRYDYKLFRPENMVVCISDTGVVTS